VYLNLIDVLGKKTIEFCQVLGDLGLFVYEAFESMFTSRPKLERIFYHVNYIGVNSLGVVMLVGITVGAAIALQSYIGLERFGATQFIGPIVYISMTREFGPVFTAIMVIGRAGSAITSELGTMRITEQIDALQTLCIDTKQYLIVPRLIAATLIMPFLSLFCTLFGVAAGYVVAVYLLGINPETYTQAIIENVELSDITNGLIKATVFGFLLTIITTYKGFYARGGARGVGIAITQSVVYSILTVAVADYILTSLMFANK
jgi:phospholipid/cholesterol/gamma-HCH transport system permease protein